jgi:CDP-diacylglycerol--serine O-phosphatidyltransferase
LRLARFNLTSYNQDEIWKQNYFEGVPSPIGALLILSPLTLELSNISLINSVNYFVPIFTSIIALLLISKVPTYSFKNIKIKPTFTVFILLAIGISLITLIFFTFETLIVFTSLYILSIPIACYTYIKNKKSLNTNNSEEEHEDVL